MTRRRFMRLVAAAGIAGVTLDLGLSALRTAPQQFGETRVLMGTIVNLTVLGAERGHAQAAIAATLGRMGALESIVSRFLPHSQLARLNEQGFLSDAAPELLDILSLAERMSVLSDGAFDVTVKPLLDLYQRYQADDGQTPPPDEIAATLALIGHQRIRIEGNAVSLTRPGMGITLDGIAKGYIVDVAVAVLRQQGFGSVLVEAGGDLSAAGMRDAHTPWRIGIQSPRRQQSGLVASFSVSNQAVATSGDYMQPYTPDFRLHHITDPHTGYSSPELASVTVSAPTAAEADALATTLMVTGSRKGLDLLAALPGCAALCVTKDLSVVRSPGFAGDA
jgi:FAD:protein FMN transferase